MDGPRFGAIARAVRVRLGLRQEDVGARARVSASVVSRLEHGRIDSMSIATIDRIATALDIRVDLLARWRG